jgi:hypothetical protein
LTGIDWGIAWYCVGGVPAIGERGRPRLPLHMAPAGVSSQAQPEARRGAEVRPRGPRVHDYAERRIHLPGATNSLCMWSPLPVRYAIRIQCVSYAEGLAICQEMKITTRPPCEIHTVYVWPISQGGLRFSWSRRDYASSPCTSPPRCPAAWGSRTAPPRRCSSCSAGERASERVLFLSDMYCMYGVPYREGRVYITTPPCQITHTVCI